MFGLSARADLYHRLTHRVFGPLHRRIVTDVTAAAANATSTTSVPPPSRTGPAGVGRVLDVGTGPGRLAVAIAHAAPHLHVDGVDLSPAMIAAARRDCAAAGLAERVTFEVADVGRLPYPDATFDLVVSSMSLHHWSDPRAGMRDLLRVVRPDGQIWIYDARPALRRGVTAARAALPDHRGPIDQVADRAVRVEPIRTGRFPIALLGRIVVHRPG
jgi:SAM-dependent methyltransferase